MQRIFCVCNTYFQLIVALQLKATLWKEESVSIAISDHSSGSEEIFERVRELCLFEKCVYIRTKGRDPANPTKAEELKKVSSFVTGRDPLWDCLGDAVFDEMVYFNQRNSIYTLFARLYSKNKEIRVSRFEEGIFSYAARLPAAEGTARLRRAIGRKSLEDALSVFYCFYPELYKGPLEAVRIPKMEAEGGVSELLRGIFRADTGEDAYTRKYIFFTSGFDFDGGGDGGEMALIKRVADLVGRDNLLVKVHPRLDVNDFIAEGLSVDPNSGMPWEVIQLGRDFSRNVFLSVYSGTAMSISLLQERPPKVWYLYRFFDMSGSADARRLAGTVEEILSDKLMRERAPYINTAESLDDIL